MMIEKELGWYEKFEKGLDELEIKGVKSLIKKIENAEGKETQDKVDEIKSLVEKIKLTKAEKEKVFEKFAPESTLKGFTSSNYSLEYVKNQFTKKARLLQSRVVRAVPEDFGLWIKKLRNDKGYSLKQVESITGISPSYINRIEKGERKTPSYPIIEKLAEAYSVDIAELLKIAGLDDDNLAQNVQNFPQMVYSSNFTINGKIVSSKQKEVLIEIISKLDEVKWDETSKHLDTVELIQLINSYKNIQK